MTEFAVRTLEIFHPDLRALPEAVFCHVVASLPDAALAEQPPVVALLRWRLREGDTLEQALDRAEEVDRYAAAVATYLGLAASGVADYLCSLATWEASGEKVTHLFTRQSVPMVWDFAEAEPGRAFARKLESVARVLERLPADQRPGTTWQAPALCPSP